MSERFEGRYGTVVIPKTVERAITRAHDHEGPNNRPLWLIWKMVIGSDGITDGPQLDSICDTVRSAHYHAAMLEDRAEWHRRNPGHGEFRYHVERVPANHSFGHSDLKAYEEFVKIGKQRADLLYYRRPDLSRH